MLTITWSSMLPFLSALRSLLTVDPAIVRTSIPSIGNDRALCHVTSGEHCNVRDAESTAIELIRSRLRNPNRGNLKEES